MAMDIEDREPLIDEPNDSGGFSVRNLNSAYRPYISTASRAWLPKRYRLFGLLLVAAILHGALRSNFDLALVAMVNDTSHAEVNVADRCPGSSGLINISKHQSSNDEFSWSASQQSQLLTGFYYGYAVTVVPGGYFSERLGGKLLLGWGSFLAGVFTLLLPMVALVSYPALLVCRVAVGLASGPVYASLFSLASRWAPKFEVTILLGVATCGFPLGFAISLATSGLMINSGIMGGWPSVFYIYGSLLVLWSLCWMVIGSSSPALEQSISQQERSYIEENTENRDKFEYKNPPLGSLLSSPAVLSLWLVTMTDWFGLYVLHTEMATFLGEMLGYDITEDDGLLLSLMYTASCLSTVFACPLVDYFRSRGIMSTRAVRLITSLIGEFSIAAVLLAIALGLECNRWAVVLLLSVGQLLYGITSAGFMLSAMDIAPTYAGTITGVADCFGAMMYCVAPMVVGAIVGDTHTRKSWRNVFLITAAILIFGVLVFSAFCKGEELTWAKRRGRLKPQDMEGNVDTSDGNRRDCRRRIRTLSELDVITEEDSSSAATDSLNNQ